MIVLGLLLVLLAVGAATVALTAPMPTAQVIELTAVGVTVKASPLAMFLAGAASVLMLGLGLALISKGTRGKARARRELRELRKDQAATTAAAEAGASSIRPDGLRDGSGTDTAKSSSKDNGSQLQPGRGSDSEPPSSP
jgi:hypothetical protein